MAPSTKQTEEKKRTLPPGHPQAGYTGSDPSAADDGIGTLAPEAQEWHDRNQEAFEKQRDAIAEHEDKVAKEEEKAAADAAKAEAKETTPKSTSGSTSSS